MKEIKTTRTVEEVRGYEAIDGTFFETKEECRKYEKTANAVIGKRFYDICVKDSNGKCAISEWRLWEFCGFASDENYLVVADIQNEKDLDVVNMYREARRPNAPTVTKDYIGEKVLIAIGNDHYDNRDFYLYGTEDEVAEMILANMHRKFAESR